MGACDSGCVPYHTHVLWRPQLHTRGSDPTAAHSYALPTVTFTPSPTVTPTPLSTATVTPLPTPTPTPTPNGGGGNIWLYWLLDFLLLSLLFAVFIGALYLLFRATAWLARRPTPTLMQLERLSADTRTRDIADESRRTITEQNDWVSGLLVLVIVVAAWCRLDADSSAQVRDAVTQTVLQRAPAIFFLSVMLAAVGLFRELDIGPLRNIPFAVLVSLLFGVSSVITVLLAPRFFGMTPVEVMPTELALNAVVDITVNFQKDRLKGWYNRAHRRE